MQIAGTRALITGGSRGIGLAVAEALLAKGAQCVGLLARDAEALAAAASRLRAAGHAGQTLTLPVDVRDPPSLRAALESFAEQAGGIDILVNCAGVLIDGAMISFSFRGVARYSLEDWQATLDTNLRGAFIAAQWAAEAMIRKRLRGVIVNVSSISRHGRAGQSAYSASKGGVASLTATLAQELAPFGIRCAAVAPGLVDTAMAQQIPEAYRKQMLEHVSVGRMAAPAEIAHGIVFCVENDFFNGRVLELDGGAFG